MAKVAITVNGSAPSNIFPPMILGSSAAANGDDVVIFCCPGGAPTMVKRRTGENFRQGTSQHRRPIQ